ncbi:P-loop containing nucleoside triphosphate hydrolase protein [Coprinopsis sp. MPI-PUGE-AT-0042]|nr:P-loop containing nucleoside triphosphate hydrolase protein [Coprinopsis sp. MPI-PUGE-AT-0042]
MAPRTPHPLPDDRTIYTDKDALILIMGPSGSGKSTFINSYLGREAAPVTHSYSSCTTTVSSYCAPCPVESTHSPKRQVVLVDTPGLFGGDLNELATLEQISSWLKPKDGLERRLTGIVYLHDMTQKRLQRETKLSLDLFRKICGENSCPKTVLVKTQWPRPPDGQSLERGKGLDSDFFKTMTTAGAKCMDIRDGVTERNVIEYILTNAVAQDIILELQRELQVKGTTLANTAAGRELKACLLELLCHTDPRSQKEQVAVINRTIRELTTNPTLSQRFKSWLSKVQLVMLKR